MASSILDLVIRQGILLPVPINFEFGLGTALGWREWVDNELSDMGFMGLLQRAGLLKAVILSRCLSNYRDLYNLRNLVCRWCTTTHTFFFSYGELIVTLEDVANQLLLPILDDADPAALELLPIFFQVLYVCPPCAYRCVLALQVRFWVPSLLCHKALILPFSHQDRRWGEPAVGPYVLWGIYMSN